MTTAGPRNELSSTFVLLQVIPALDAGGAERAAIDVGKAVVDAGGRSLIATSGGRLADEAARAGSRICVGPFQSKNPITMAMNTARLRALIHDNQVSVIHARSRAPAWSAYSAARQSAIPFVTTYHGIYESRSRLKRAYNSVMARGDTVIANSEWTAAHIRGTYPAAAARIAIIPRGIDIGRFTLASVGRERIELLRAQWQLNDDPLVLMPERLTSWKGHSLLLEAAARLQHRKFNLVLAGDPQGRQGYVDELNALIDKLGLRERTRIPGHCSDMPAAFALADIVVVPSIQAEAFGRVAVEAQAMERLVIASALGAQTETVIDGVTGWLFPPGDIPALTARLDAAFDLSAEQKKKITHAASERARSLYSTERMCAQTLDVYSKLLARAPAGV